MAGLGQSQKPPCPPQIAPILERRCSFCTQAAAWNPVGGVNFPTLPWADLAGQRPQKVPGAWRGRGSPGAQLPPGAGGAGASLGGHAGARDLRARPWLTGV